MYQPTTLGSIAPLAQALTQANLVLSVGDPSYPLQAMVNAYGNPVVGDQRPLNDVAMQVAQEDFAEANAEPTEEDGAVVDRLAKLMATGMLAVTHNARNVIVPAVNAYTAAFNERQAESVQPKIEISVFNYNPVHDDPRLVNHLASRYTQVAQRESYRSFILPKASAEQVIEMVSNNNPHLDAPLVTEWLLHVGADTIASVWDQLFSMRVINPLTLPLAQRQRLPFSVDELLLAYCLVGHFIENPTDVQGENVDLEEWSLSMQKLHEFFGAALLGAYGRRAEQLKREVLVLKSDGADPIGRRTVEVVANGDIYGPWLEQGGDVQVLLGGAILNPSVTRVADFAQHSAVFMQKWLQIYPLLCQALSDDCVRKRREDLLVVMTSPNKDVATILPQIVYSELLERLRASLRQTSDKEFENVFLVVTKLVCQAYFPNPVYASFLAEMEHAAKIHGGTDVRSLAAVALIAVGGDWLRSQIQVNGFDSFVNPNLAPLEAVDNGQSQATPVAGEGVVSNETQELEDTQARDEALAAAEANGVSAENAEVAEVVENVETGLGAPTDGAAPVKGEAAAEVVEPGQENKSDDIKMKILRSKIDK